MASIAQQFATTFRNFVTDGVSASGKHAPKKTEIQALGQDIEAAIGNVGLGSMLAVTSDTRTNLDGDLAYNADSMALVWGDATDANNDLYIKAGASGSGSWTLTTTLHDILSGLGTPFVTDAEIAQSAAEAAQDAALVSQALAQAAVSTAQEAAEGAATTAIDMARDNAANISDQSDISAEANIALFSSIDNDPPFNSIYDLGWKLHVTTPVEPAPLTPLKILQKGFAANGTHTVYAREYFLTKHVRNLVPDDDTFTANDQALNRPLYDTSYATNVAGASAMVVRKADMVWCLPHRIIVGNTITQFIAAGHPGGREGRFLACARARATDGVNYTEWVTQSEVSLLSEYRSKKAIEGFLLTVDISSLDDETLITFEGEGYPWNGDARSIRSTADFHDVRDFSPRYYRKDVARAAQPPICFISSSGSDVNGRWKTNLTDAKATPFATRPAANQAIVDANNTAVTGGKSDGCQFIFAAGDHTIGSDDNITQIPSDGMASILTRDTAELKESVTLLYGDSGTQLKTATLEDLPPELPSEGQLQIRDISTRRVGFSNFQDGRYRDDNGDIQDIPITIDFIETDDDLVGNSYSTKLFNAGQSSGTWYGAKWSNIPANSNAPLANNGGAQNRGFFGCEADDMNGSNITGHTIIGCKIPNHGGLVFDRPNSGIFYVNNEAKKLDGALQAINVDAQLPDDEITRCTIWGNLIEYIGTDTDQGRMMQLGTLRGAFKQPVVGRNTVASGGRAGAIGFFYDDQDSSGDLQDHTAGLVIANIFATEVAIKGDEANNIGANSGNIEYDHGVGLEYNVFALLAASEVHRLDYYGMGAVVHNSTDTLLDIRFIDDRSAQLSTGVVTAGIGGGNYELQSDSLAKNLVPAGFLPCSYNLDKEPLSTIETQNAGCY